MPAQGASCSTETPVPSPGDPVPAAPQEIYVSGRVRTHDGCAEPGCEVEAFVANDMEDLTRSAGTVICDRDGRFSFQGLARVKTRLTASAGLLESSLVVDLAAEASGTGLDIVLPQEWHPLVRVVDESGRRVPGGKIRVDFDRRAIALDALGQARPRLSADQHQFIAFGPPGNDREYISCNLVAGPIETEVTIVCGEWGFADGVVLDPDGVPIPHMRLNGLVEGYEGYYPIRSFDSGETGFRVEIPVGKTATLYPTKPWKSGGADDAGGIRYFTGMLENVRPDDRHLVFRTHWVDLDRTLKVRCFSPERTPLRNFSAQAWFGGRDRDYHNRPDAEVEADSCGVCQLNGLPEMPAELGVSLDGYFAPAGWISPDSATVTPNGQEIEFHFRRGTILEGRAYLPDGSFATRSMISVDGTRKYCPAASTDDAGRFSITLDAEDSDPIALHGSLTLSGAEYEGTLQQVLPGTMELRLQLLPVTK